jgi:hypothetical protein
LLRDQILDRFVLNARQFVIGGFAAAVSGISLLEPLWPKQAADLVGPQDAQD